MSYRVYTLTYNSADMVPHFLHHYRDAEKIVVYDNGSTDDTRKLLNADSRVEIHDYTIQSGNSLRDDVHGHIKNHCWKSAKGQTDWVVVVDFDEFLYHPNLMAKLDEYKKYGASVLSTTAFEMVSRTFPTPPAFLTDTVKMGRRNDIYSKLVVFDPNKITEINYGPGGHKADPRGEITFSAPYYAQTVPVPPYTPLIVQRAYDPMKSNIIPPVHDMKILHYRFIGLDRIAAMWERYKHRMSARNMANKWGSHYFMPKEEQERIFALLETDAEQVIP